MGKNYSKIDVVVTDDYTQENEIITLYNIFNRGSDISRIVIKRNETLANLGCFEEKVLSALAALINNTDKIQDTTIEERKELQDFEAKLDKEMINKLFKI